LAKRFLSSSFLVSIVLNTLGEVWVSENDRSGQKNKEDQGREQPVPRPAILRSIRCAAVTSRPSHKMLWMLFWLSWRKVVLVET